MDNERGENENGQGVEAPDEQEAVTELELDTLSGDLRDAMLTRFRDVNTAWSAMSEEKQRDFCNGIELAAKDLVRRTVRLLTKYDFPKCVVDLGEVKIIGGDKARIEAKITALNIPEYRDVLGEHVSSKVMLLCVDSDEFMGERGPAQVDPDQPELPVEGSDPETESVPSTMLRKARDVILKERAASTSLVQRRLAIGYNKAARILEMLEEEGFVSKPDASGKRSIIGEEDSGDEAA